MDRNGELALLPLDHEEAGALLASIPEDRRTDCWWLILRDGSPVQGDRGGAVLLLTALRVTRPIGLVLDFLRLSPVLDLLDKALAQARGQLSRFVPDGPAPRSFP